MLLFVSTVCNTYRHGAEPAETVADLVLAEYQLKGGHTLLGLLGLCGSLEVSTNPETMLT